MAIHNFTQKSKSFNWLEIENWDFKETLAQVTCILEAVNFKIRQYFITEIDIEFRKLCFLTYYKNKYILLFGIDWNIT